MIERERGRDTKSLIAWRSSICPSIHTLGTIFPRPSIVSPAAVAVAVVVAAAAMIAARSGAYISIIIAIKMETVVSAYSVERIPVDAMNPRSSLKATNRDTRSPPPDARFAAAAAEKNAAAAAAAAAAQL